MPHPEPQATVIIVGEQYASKSTFIARALGMWGGRGAETRSSERTEAFGLSLPRAEGEPAHCNVVVHTGFANRAFEAPADNRHLAEACCVCVFVPWSRRSRRTPAT